MSALDELAATLRLDYDLAPANRKVVSIHLFAIRHRAALAGLNKQDVAERAGLPRSYGTELQKGLNLGEYVEIIRPLV